MASAETAVASSGTVVDYLHCLRGLGFEPSVRGIWASVGTTGLAYGWKLHLSSTQTQAPAVLDAIAPVLHRHLCAFKTAADATILGQLNEGAFGATQIGKFATIYPSDPDAARVLSDELIDVTDRFGGPAVRTDLHVGGIVYARYGSHSPSVVRDRLGQYIEADPEPGSGYQVPFVAPDHIRNPFAEDAKPQPGAPPPDLFGPGYLVSRVLQGHPKGAVLRALDLRTQDTVGEVVLKEGRPGCMSDLQGRDIVDRLAHQHAVHSELTGAMRVPAPGPLFKHAASTYLPLEFIQGRDLLHRQALPYIALGRNARDRLLAELTATATVIADLHEHGWVHRDISPRNVRIDDDGNAWLLDLEICHRAGDDTIVPYSQGTAGFVSPAQIKNAVPTLADDVFSFGSIGLWMLTGCDPQRVQHLAPATVNRVRQLSGAPEWLCSLVAACVDHNGDHRPTMTQVVATLEAGTNDLGSQPIPPAELTATIGPGLSWLIAGAPRDERGVWLSVELGSEHANVGLAHGFKTYRSANRGAAGPLYLLAKAHRWGFETPGAVEVAGQAVDWLLRHDGTPDDQMSGLHFGEAGVAVAIAETVASGLIDTGPWLLPYMSEALLGPLDWPDVTHGAAGLGLGSLLSADLLGWPELAKHADRCADHLIATQEPDGSWRLPAGVQAMEGDVYYGFAHGVAGIVGFLAHYATRVGSTSAAQSAQAGGRWLLSKAAVDPSGMNLTWAMSTQRRDVWHWWCHGGPGVALSLMALCRLDNDNTFAGAAKSALRIHAVDVRHSNLSQCHGLAGLGEALLDAHDLFGEPEWHERAAAIASLLQGLAGHSEAGCTWLVENPYQPTADLMVGSAGVLHFMCRLASGPHPRFGSPLMPTWAAQR